MRYIECIDAAAPRFPRSREVQRIVNEPSNPSLSRAVPDYMAVLTAVQRLNLEARQDIVINHLPCFRRRDARTIRRTRQNRIDFSQPVRRDNRSPSMRLNLLEKRNGFYLMNMTIYQAGHDYIGIEVDIHQPPIFRMRASRSSSTRRSQSI